MRNRPLLLAVGTVFLLAVIVTVGLLLALRHEPAFYRRQAVPPGVERKARCGEFKTEFTQFLDGLLNQPRQGWYAKFSDFQVNSYLEEDCEHENLLKLPADVEGPRVAFEPDRLRVGFRHGSGWLASVVSLDLRIWLAPREPNVVAIEVVRARRGAVPISTHPFLERISEMARQRGVDLTWFRYSGAPVALARLVSEQPRTAVQLQRLELGPTTILISGTGPEAAAARPAEKADPGE